MMKRILVVGAYGFIGAHVTAALCAHNHHIIALGRNKRTAKKVAPYWQWIFHDLRDLKQASQWEPIIEDIDIVINCAGALQENATDNLAAVHIQSIEACAKACYKQDKAIIQISAVGANTDSTNPFMETKAKGDQAIINSGVRHWIFKPGFVLASNAYGGSALLRMICATPIIQPVALPDAKIQTVSIHDICRTVLAAINGQIPEGTNCDLVEETAHNLTRIVHKTRQWLGFPNSTATFRIPDWAVTIASKTADILSKLGWRSPLRTSAIKALKANIIGDPGPLNEITGQHVSSLDETMRSLQVNSEHRLQARLALVMPLLVTVLSVFWLLSGVIGLSQINTASSILTRVGWPIELAQFAVIFWAFVDIGLGTAILFKKYAQKACLAMLAVCLIYITSGSLFTPILWADPLGPLVKILPTLALSCLTYILMEQR